MNKVLEQIKHKGDTYSTNQTIIMRNTMTEHMLRHHQQIVLEIIQPAPREENKNDSAHNAYGYGATFLFLFTIIHILNFLQHNG